MILYWASKKKNCVRGKPADFLFGNLGRTFLCGRFIFAITGEYTNMKLQLIKRPNGAQSIPYKIARAVYAETNAKSLRVVEALTSMIKNNAVSTGNNIEDIISNNNLFIAQNNQSINANTVDNENSNRGFQMCLRVAQRMLNGGLPDCCYGATCFHHADVIPQWATARGYIADIDGLLFYI